MLEAFRMRRAGAPYQRIVEHLGYRNAQQAYIDILKVAEKDPAESMAMVRDLAYKRLEVMLNAVWEEVENGDRSSIHTALRIMERQARMLGLDEPEKFTFDINASAFKSLEEKISNLDEKEIRRLAGAGFSEN